KYEEIVAPSLNQFVYITDGLYKPTQIIEAERFILQALDFSLHYPNPFDFLRRCSRGDAYDIPTRTIGKYLLEISMLDEYFLLFPPSLIAASSMYLGRAIMGHREIWTKHMKYYSGYDDQELKDC